jgi:hypothetical protein
MLRVPSTLSCGILSLAPPNPVDLFLNLERLEVVELGFVRLKLKLVSMLSRDAAWLRMQGAGAQLVSLFAAASEMAVDWREDLQGLTDFYTKYIPSYATVIESWPGATNTTS